MAIELKIQDSASDILTDIAQPVTNTQLDRQTDHSTSNNDMRSTCLNSMIRKGIIGPLCFAVAAPCVLIRTSVDLLLVPFLGISKITDQLQDWVVERENRMTHDAYYKGQYGDDYQDLQASETDRLLAVPHLVLHSPIQISYIVTVPVSNFIYSTSWLANEFTQLFVQKGVSQYDSLDNREWESRVDLFSLVHNIDRDDYGLLSGPRMMKTDTDYALGQTTADLASPARGERKAAREANQVEAELRERQQQ